DKLRKFTIMMKARGHEVLLYAGDRTEAPCDELITCFTEADRLEHLGDRHYSNAVWSARAPGWQRLNENAIREIRKRARPRDFVCISGGIPHKPIGDALTDMRIVEYGIGYNRTFAKYRVFESYGWMHMMYG